MKKFFVLLVLGTISTQCFSMGNYKDSNDFSTNMPRNATHHISRFPKFWDIEFNREFADKTNISRAEQTANEDLRWVFGQPKDIDEAFNLIVKGSSASHIINCAKALRHVQNVTSTSHERSHFFKDKKVLLNADLLILSMWLINHVRDNFNVCEDDEYQLGQTKLHLAELQDILDRKRGNHVIARKAAIDEEITKETLSCILEGSSHSLKKNEIVWLSSLQTKEDRTSLEDELLSLYQRVAKQYPSKVKYQSRIPSRQGN